MTRDEFNRCVVCGRREGEACCEDCHRGHDYAWEHPQWSAIGMGHPVPAIRLPSRYYS